MATVTATLIGRLRSERISCTAQHRIGISPGHHMTSTHTRPPDAGAPPGRGRLTGGGMGLFKALAGLAVPLLLVYGLIQVAVVRPARTPPPPAVDAGPVDTPGQGIQLTGGVDGAWTLVTGDASWVGYRIEERFMRLSGPTEGVGRTHDVQATMRVEGAVVTAVDVTADLRTLESGDWRRDQSIRLRWLESDRYPEVTFRLDEPIDLGSPPEPGAVVSETVTGTLTIRDVPRAVAVPVEARWDGNQVEIAGVVTVTLADFGIATPGLPSYVQAADEADIELQLVFARR
jgi:polyisoprenoid-binding protein YceI